MTEQIEIGGRTLHLRMSLRAIKEIQALQGGSEELADVKIDGNDLDKVIEIVSIVANAGAKFLNEEPIERDWFLDAVTAADVEPLTEALVRCMGVAEGAGEGQKKTQAAN